MKSRLIICLIKIQFLIIILIMVSGCGLKYTVKGKVVDAETGEPIEGAVYAVYWYSKCEAYYKSGCAACCLIPFAGGNPFGVESCPGEGEEGFTDANGRFKIVKHADTGSSMAVYKKGYICWSQHSAYHPEFYDDYKAGKVPYKKIWASRQDNFKIGSGMVVKLKPWKKEFSKSAAIGHAEFCKGAYMSLRGETMGGVSNLFHDAIWPEILLLKKHKR